MELLEKVDVFILDRLFQPVADWWQNLTGKNNFWLARMTMWAALIVYTWMVITLENIFLLIIMSVVLLSVTYALLIVIRRLERNERNAEDSPFGNKFSEWRLFFPFGILRLLLIMGVMMFIIPSPGQFKSIWGYITLLWVALYFGACTPLRPPTLRAGNNLAANSSA